MVYRICRFQLSIAAALHFWSLTSSRYGRPLGDPNRCASRLWHLFANLFRPHRMAKQTSTSLGFIALLFDWTSAGFGRRWICFLLHCCVVGLLPPGEAALRFHGPV